MVLANIDRSIFDANIEGEGVFEELEDMLSPSSPGTEFTNLCTGEKIWDWDFKDENIVAQVYLGGLGIAKAYEELWKSFLRLSGACPIIAVLGGLDGRQEEI
jgi:hypothetical protein